MDDNLGEWVESMGVASGRSKKRHFGFLFLFLFLFSSGPIYRDGVLPSDARLHVNPIHFLARRAVC